ncbi:gluconolactonase [Paenibacillus sp. 32O-W]|uniref:YIP1 family protein n=1 Tax=Paenibacillus sp. 32O-W TaxID=1695218 RepID=UPI00071F17BF|nr:YIP1 family protein [Paenibacillus sp. 32O-W]ALS29060.1 gluconolactonase [Paenibacillus sp. 32O-W]
MVLHLVGRTARIGLVCLLSLAFISMKAHAEAPYRTYFENGNGREIPTRPAYSPAGVIGDDIYVDDGEGGTVHSPLKRPQDLFIDANDHIYIADTDNNRVVEFDDRERFVREIRVPESPLKSPQGVFVTDDGDIYIADTGNKRVVRLDRELRLVREYVRPQSELIHESFIYEPTNMVVDSNGFVFVVSKGSYQGVVQFEPDGAFFGFFGANATEVKLMDRIRRLLYTKEQLSRQVRLLPPIIRNIEIDGQGYIYTVSGSSKEQVKKLNIRSENVWKELSFGEKVALTPEEREKDVQLTDLAVDAGGNMTVIDKNLNMVSQYDASGKLQFFWKNPASSAAVLGLTQSPVAVDTNSHGELFILDDALNVVQKLKPTAFGAAIRQAFMLTQSGNYKESVPYWEEVIKLNALFSPAYHGLAQAAFNEGDYAKAIAYYKLAGDAAGYSDSFWQLRLQWFQRHFSLIANSLLIASVALAVALRLKRNFRFGAPSRPRRKRPRQTWIRQLRHAFYILKHPLDGFSDLRFKNSGGYVSAFLLLGSAVLVLLVKTYYTGFSFNPRPASELNGGFIMSGFLVSWLSWVVCHYLIGSIQQGEARFKDVFVGSSYALFPFVLLSLPLALVSNVLTLSEASIYQFFEWGAMLWCGALFFWKIQSLQNYSVGETVVNIALTLLAMIVMWVLIFTVFGLASELVSFGYTIYQEVTK